MATATNFGGLGQLPKRRAYQSHDDGGRPLSGLLATDGSWAEVYHDTDAAGKHQVEQGGPRRLFDESKTSTSSGTATAAQTGPSSGLTATQTHRHLWYQTPTSEHIWPLSTTPA
ncbi:hypothetical protein JOF29_000112 [Kribbella aluminosa]|uniref:Uncharacterized protein n=1 Tax=Kribbella aluminosa TaxID=416017 RepID=A0ABS4UBR5_9ACTN|nr:hypothetical protein [Kribbella aluminosa]